jgi:hypothetical protein
VGDDLVGLLRTLAAVLEPSQLVVCHAFLADPPSTAFGWDAQGLGSWGAPPQKLQQGAAQAAGGDRSAAADGNPAGDSAEAATVDLTEDLPQTPSRLLAAATWQAAMVDTFGVHGGWDLLAQVRLVPACRCPRSAAHRPVFARCWPRR